MVKRKQQQQQKSNEANLTEQSHNLGISMLSKLVVFKTQDFIADWESQTQSSNAEVPSNCINSNVISWTNVVKKIKSNQA